MTRRPTALAAALGLALVFAGCSATSTEPETAAQTATAAPTAAEISTPPTTAALEPPEAAEAPEATGAAGQAISLPSLPVVDLISGAEVQLDQLEIAGPALLWFWAPH